MNCASACAVDDVTIVQRAFELIAEQRAEILAVAHAFEKRHRRPHALRSQVDGEMIGVLLVGVREIAHCARRRRPPHD